MKTYSLFAVLLFSLSKVLIADVSWRDERSGREYLLVENELPWYEASKTCYSQGYAVLDVRTLNDEERKNLLNSEMLKKLRWEEKFKGTPNATSEARIWQSSEMQTIVIGGAPYISTLVLLEKGNKLFTSFEWKSPTENRLNTLCMSVPGFWFRCSTEFKCVHETANNKISMRHLFTEYGNTQNEAYQKIVKRSEEPTWSVTEGKCSLQTETSHCLRILP